jgi:hypothetical protein
LAQKQDVEDTETTALTFISKYNGELVGKSKIKINHT